MTSWAELIIPTVAATMVLIIPGLAPLWVLRVRGVALFGLSGPVSVAIIGGSAVIAAQAGVRFSPLTPLSGAVVAVAVAFLLRRFTPIDYRRSSRLDFVVLVPVALATAVAAAIAFGSVASPSWVSQTYDGVFHVNAVAWILDYGDASSFHLYRMTHPSEGIEFYPAAWHATAALVAQLTGTSVATATIATWIASTGAIFCLGTAFLADTVWGRARHRLLVASSAALASTATAAGPYLLLKWGVLYPTGLAYALIPAGLALGIIALRSIGHRSLWFTAGLLIVWVTASGFAHPRSLVSFAVLSLPLVIGSVIGWVRRGLRFPETRRRTLMILAGGITLLGIAVALGAGLVLRYFRADVRPIADRLNGGPATARQTFADSLFQAFTLAPPTGPGESMLPVGIVVAIVVVAALVVALVIPRTRWLATSFILAAFLYALAAGSNSDLAKIATGFWYKDKYRLFAMLGLLAPVLIALLIATVADAVPRLRAIAKRPRIAAVVAPVLLLAVLISAWAGPTLGAMRTSIASDWSVAATKDGRLLDAAEFDLLSRLPELVEPGAVVVGNPWDGSSLSWAIGDRESLFPHLTGDWDPDRVTVATRLDAINDDPEVCAALRSLDVRYVLVSDGLLWNGDPAAGFYDSIGRAAGGPGMELIDEEGSTRLYLITACG